MAGPAPHRIAAFVILPRGCVIAPIFQRLAQRKTQINAIHILSIRPRFRALHPRNVFVAETVCLEIGEAEPGYAPRRTRVWSSHKGGAIVRNGFIRPARDFKRIRPEQTQFRGIRSRRLISQQSFIEIDHRLVVAQADAGRAIGLEVLSVTGAVPEQDFGLLPRPSVFLLLQQYHGIIQARGVVVRRLGEHHFQ